jgi:hypothetical protein
MKVRVVFRDNKVRIAETNDSFKCYRDFIDLLMGYSNEAHIIHFKGCSVNWDNVLYIEEYKESKYC